MLGNSPLFSVLSSDERYIPYQYPDRECRAGRSVHIQVADQLIISGAAGAVQSGIYTPRPVPVPGATSR